MNNTLELIPYKSSSTEDDSLLATGIVALATLAVAVMQHYGSSDTTKTPEPLRISIPSYVEEVATTPPPPPTVHRVAPPAPSRPKKVVTDDHDELDKKILWFLCFKPGSSAKEMLKAFKTKDPSLTKSDINSRLYTMLIRKVLRKDGDTNWFLV